jgi:hypothetical protein
MFAKIDTGSISQFSIYAVVLFSYLINYWRRTLVVSLIALFILAMFNYSHAFAAVGGPGVCGTLCMANRNYYGQPYGQNLYYPYPMLPFHSFYGPSPYYFRPYGPSPYQPYNCIECMQRYQQFTSPMGFPTGGGMTLWQIPLQAPIVSEVTN